jgi:hypothetical protein
MRTTHRCLQMLNGGFSFLVGAFQERLGLPDLAPRELRTRGGSSFDDLIRPQQQRGRDREAERFAEATLLRDGTIR